MGRRAKLLIAASATLLVAVFAASWAPRVIAPRLLAAVEDLANKQLRGELSIGATSLSALRDFPQLTLTVDDVSLVGADDFFPEEEILAAERIEATLALWPALRGEYIVDALVIRDGQVSMHVAEDGTASWDVVVATPEAPEAPAADAEAPPLLLDVSALELDNVSIAYLDVPGDSVGLVESISGTGALNIRGDELLMTLRGGSPAVSYTLDELDYISRGAVSLDATLRSDLEGGTYTVTQSALQINALPLVIDGTVAFIEEGMDLSLAFDAPEASFKDLLSAVPAIYARDYESMDASGQIALRAAVDGRVTEALVPGLALELAVTDGRFRYPDLPGEVRDIQVDASLTSPEGADMDALTVDIRSLSGSLGGQPFDVQMKISDTQTDPLIDGRVRMDLDLGRLGEFVPLSEDETYAGQVRADVQLRGRTSDMSAGRYAEVTASGPITLAGFRYSAPDLPNPIEITRAELALLPSGLRIDQLQARTGGSDASVTGQLDDLMGYLFEDGPLQGALSIQSQRIDLADFSEESEEPAAEAAAPSGPVVVPAGYALTLDLDADEVVYDDITLSAVSGRVGVADQRATLSGVTARGFGGELAIDGSYTARSTQAPRVDIDVAVTGLDIPQVASQLDLASAVMPLVSSARGAFSADLSLEGSLDDAMGVVLDSLSSAGVISAQQLSLSETPLTAALADVTGLPALSQLSIGALKMRYDLDGGRIKVDPTRFQLGAIPATLSGAQGLDQSLDYTLALELPTTSPKIRGLLSGALASQLPDTVPVVIDVGGSLTAPKLSLSLAAAREQLRSVVEDTVREAASDAAQQLLDEASQRAEGIMDAARAASDALLSEASDQADALVRAAKNPVAEALAEKAADVLMKEARKRSRQLLNKAEAQAQSILDEAAAKAAAL